MDPSLFMMLSNLLQLHNYLDPALPTSSLADAYSSSAPLLFFVIASVLSHAAALRSRSTSSSSSPTSASTTTTTTTATTTTTNTTTSTTAATPNSSSDRNVDAFRSLTNERIWSMEPQTRDAQWRSAYGLSYPVFANLVDQLKPHLQKSLAVDLGLPPDYAVAIVLSRLAHGHSLKAMAAHYKLKPYQISKLTNLVTRLLATKLYSNYIRTPGGHHLLETIHAFREITGLPNVCGAIDGSYVKLARTTEARIVDPASFRCRYGYCSILLQVVSDHRKIFWDVCVKAPGASDDATHFRDSALYNRLTSGEILRDTVISVRGHHVRPYIIGDWCYPLLSFLLTPFTSNSTGTLAQNFFDASLMKGRSMVEQAIGLLKGRWRILQDLNVGINHAPQTIVACCVLHNICQFAGEPEPVLYKEPKESGPPSRALENEKSFYYFGESLRQAIADEIQERQQRLPTR